MAARKILTYPSNILGLTSSPIDIENCKRLSNNITKVLIDDTNFTRIKNVCDEYVEKGFLTEISEEYGIHTKTHRLYKYVFD